MGVILYSQATKDYHFDEMNLDFLRATLNASVENIGFQFPK